MSANGKIRIQTVWCQQPWLLLTCGLFMGWASWRHLKPPWSRPQACHSPEVHSALRKLHDSQERAPTPSSLLESRLQTPRHVWRSCIHQRGPCRSQASRALPCWSERQPPALLCPPPQHSLELFGLHCLGWGLAHATIPPSDQWCPNTWQDLLEEETDWIPSVF